jgi:hypothetical protein
MKFGIILGAVVVALPISAMAQSPAQKQADLAEALRLQQLICNGIADVRARGGDYSDHDLAKCVIALEAQRAEYARFAAAASSAAPSRIASTAARRAQMAAAQ